MSNWRTYYWKVYNEAEAYKDRCRNCPSTSSLEFAHIKPTKLQGRSRGSHRRRLDVLHNKDCYSVLCKRCHYKLDHGSAEQRASINAPPLDRPQLPFMQREQAAA